MKKFITLYIIATLFGVLELNSQTFSFYRTSPAVVSGDTSQINYTVTKGVVVNTGSIPLSVKLVRLLHQLPGPSWSAAPTFHGYTYSTQYLDTIPPYYNPVVLAPGQSDTLQLKVLGSTTGLAKFIIQCFVNNNPANSIVDTFRVFLGNAPLQITLNSPPNAALGLSLTPTLHWNDAGISYQCQVSTSPSFTTNIVDQNVFASSQFTIPSGILQYNTSYFWRVKAFVNSVAGNWSSTWNFSTITAPTLILPQNGAVGTSITPTLDWNDLPGATSYRVQVSPSESFPTYSVNQLVTSSQYIVPSGLLNNSTVYYWRVNGINSYGIGPWSPTWSFFTTTIGIRIISNEIPNEFKLYNSYPNPFNPTTNIKFDLPKNTFVKLVIYDILGKEIETLVNDKLNAGSYNVDWNASNYTSGVYFYRIETKSFTDVKRMLLVK